MLKNNIFDKKTRSLMFTGFIMGAADIVPGVSGGTIAFIMGIYEELVNSIKIMTGTVPLLLLRGKIREAFKLIPFKFIIPLAIGIGTALLSLSKLISFLLNRYPSNLWAFFFGLVLASIFIIGKKVSIWNIKNLLAMLFFGFFTYSIMGLIPVETPETLLTIFMSGAIAICAMILPGISGSLLLVMMGKYEQILSAVNRYDVLTIGVFMLGAIFGLAMFSRLLGWLLKKHYNITIAGLIGFMIGSLRKVWPWKEVLSTRINSKGVAVPLMEANIIPNFNLSFIITLLLCGVGIVFIFYLNKIQTVKEKSVSKK